MVRHTEIPMKKKAVLYWEESEKKIGKEKDPSKNPSSCRFKSVFMPSYRFAEPKWQHIIISK
jgi:hypothetical protein